MIGALEITVCLGVVLGVVQLGRWIVAALVRRRKERSETLVELWNALVARDRLRLDALLVMYGSRLDKHTLRATQELRDRLLVQESGL